MSIKTVFTFYHFSDSKLPFDKFWQISNGFLNNFDPFWPLLNFSIDFHNFGHIYTLFDTLWHILTHFDTLTIVSKKSRIKRQSNFGHISFSIVPSEIFNFSTAKLNKSCDDNSCQSCQFGIGEKILNKSGPFDFVAINKSEYTWRQKKSKLVLTENRFDEIICTECLRAQRGNYRIFLLLRFYVKSILKILEC